MIAVVGDRIELGATPVCWLCGERIADDEIATVWVGADSVAIALHIRCAECLGVHLLGDAREGQLAVGGGHWTRRAA
jgi:hypothetical protein